jgi:hypothetical protein
MPNAAHPLSPLSSPLFLFPLKREKKQEEKRRE